MLLVLHLPERYKNSLLEGRLYIKTEKRNANNAQVSERKLPFIVRKLVTYPRKIK